MKIAPSSFFDRPTTEVARDLLGCYLVRRTGGTTVRRMITETEAYDGFEDRASHARHGMTKRTEVMFRRGGHIYVYFTYGIHWMLNIVTGKKDYPAAVLIRGVEGLQGPAVLTKALRIDGLMNGKLLSKKSGLWVEIPSDRIRHSIKTSGRIGVDHSGPKWSRRHYRFYIAGHAGPATSRARRATI